MKEKIGTEVYNNADHKKLAYTQDFKDVIKNNPGVLKDFKRLTDRLDTLPLENLQNGSSEVFVEGEIKANLIKALKWDGPQRHYYFKIEINGSNFFVKSEAVPHRGKGYEEFKNTSEVKQRLKDIPWVDTVDFQLGYQDNKDRSYFVSKWRNLLSLDQYIKELESKNFALDQKIAEEASASDNYSWDDKKEEELVKGRTEIKGLKEKVQQLQKVLPEFHDLAPYNMFYDSENSTIVLFDLFTKPQDLYQGS